MTIKQTREILSLIDDLGMNAEDAVGTIDYLADMYKRDDMSAHKDWIEEGQFRNNE